MATTSPPASTDLGINHIIADPGVILPFVLNNALHVVGALAILIIGFWLAGRADFLVNRALRHSKHVDEMLRGFFSSIARYFVLTIVVLAVLSQFGIQTTSLVAVIGAASLAIGLALQGTLSNLAAGVMLLIFRPFRIGHAVTVGGNTGTVRSLSLFWTEVVTDSNTQIIIPNGSVWGQPIRNMTTYTQPVTTAQLRVPVPTGWGLNDACTRIKDITVATPKVQAAPAPSVLLDRGGTDNGIQIVITFAPDGDSTGSIKNDILRAIDEQMEKPGRQQRAA
ncbi:mechanosensitive ion channel [Acidisoma cellulosilytica]|uniref:Small-conductance mechanosensitive channel n=1 Tax=Acidisoma cellulosilyticum TaxID=2802395 RepID=A0A964E487_9PROT|nr:mechanosensitive ion channel domain-containing protein [Acidisoma cellulosilyticum]MCB8881219.1 mechanosensitive ion channel [Acidisoma cellulosilyticum]